MMNIPMNNPTINAIAAKNPAVQRFSTFVNNFQKMGKNPQQVVQELLNNGQMSQQQYNQLRQMANKIMGTNY